MKVLLLGDSPLISTGFGRVNSHAVKAFRAQGWEVAAVCNLQQDGERETDLLVKQYIPEKSDGMGIAKATEALEDFQPDVIYATGDPGSIAAFASVIPASIPHFFYIPIEGEPIVLPQWRGILRAARWMTCSAYGAKIAKRDLGVDVPWVYHGVDTEVFYPYDDERREAIRKQLGWTNDFVVMTVAANVRRKQHPRLFEAIRLLRDKHKVDNILLYDHTVPFQSFWLEGWHLPVLTQAMGIYNEVVFSPFLGEFGARIPDASEEGRPSLADLYNAADLFVLPSQVEGFGLPLVEAMACGLPVATTDYAAGKEVARKAMGEMLPVKDWEVHKSGTLYANVDPEAMAKAIYYLIRDPKRRARMRAAGLAALDEFRWEPFEEMVVAEVQKAYEAGPPSTPQDIPEAG